MAVNAIGALSAYTYQNTLTQTGSASQALSQALAASQAQADQVSALFGTSSSADSFLAQSGTGGLAALTYSAATDSGTGTDALQALLGATSQTSSLFTNSDGGPSSAALLAPSAAAALARYTYDQSQNHTATSAQTAAQAIASGQQSLLASGLNLFA
jgi:hypothetical protein